MSVSHTAAVPEPKPFKVALIQLGGITSSKEANLAHARDMIHKAINVAHKKPQLIVLPECFNSPYGHKFFPQYAETIAYVPGKPYDVSISQSDTIKMLSDSARKEGAWIVGGSFPEATGGKMYNTSTVFNPKGELVAIHRKLHLFDIDIPGKITFKESETLSAGNTLTHFDTEFGRIGIGICYDVRFPEMAMVAARQGCCMMIYPGAFNLTTGPLHWELLQRARAVDNHIYVSMCSPARDMSADYHAWGHSMVVDPMGIVVSEAEHDEAIIYADINPDIIRTTRAGIPVTAQRRFDVYSDVASGTASRQFPEA